jgi:hypothetical protein
LMVINDCNLSEECLVRFLMGIRVFNLILYRLLSILVPVASVAAALA